MGAPTQNPRRPLFQNLTPEETLDRLCSYEAIRQLAAGYCHLMDCKKFAELSELFIQDVKASPKARGREALEREFEKLTQDIGTTILKVTTHLIEFESADSAQGIVYAHGDIQMGGRWIHQAIRYEDKYERHAEIWYFAGRKHRLWYGVDAGENPLSYPLANWPENNTGLGDLVL